VRRRRLNDVVDTRQYEAVWARESSGSEVVLAIIMNKAARMAMRQIYSVSASRGTD
jgi:hypothetical protein